MRENTQLLGIIQRVNASGIFMEFTSGINGFVPAEFIKDCKDLKAAFSEGEMLSA